MCCLFLSAEYKVLCPGGEGFRPNPITVILEGRSTARTHTHTHTSVLQCCVLTSLSVCQISTSVRSCLVCVREETASTRLAVFTVNVRKVLHSVKKPESVKVSPTSSFTHSLSLSLGRLYLCSALHSEEVFSNFAWSNNIVTQFRMHFH